MEQLNLNWKQVGKKNHMMTCLKFESQTYLGQRFAIFLNDNIVATRLPLNALQDILCLNLRPSWILTSWGIGRHGWKSNHTYNEGTNLWAVRMSVQVHKLTNLKNGIESHTSSWEMWRQQIWLLNKPRISNQAGPLGDSDMLPGRPRILQLHETKNSGHEIAQPHLSQVFLHALPPLLSKVPTTISPKTTAADATWIHAIHWEKNDVAWSQNESDWVHTFGLSAINHIKHAKSLSEVRTDDFSKRWPCVTFEIWHVKFDHEQEE